MFQEMVLKRLKEIPDLWVVKTQQVAIRGTPDLLMCYHGTFIAWELKTDQGVVDELQHWTLQNITKAGGIARVVQPATFDRYFKELLDVPFILN